MGGAQGALDQSNFPHMRLSLFCFSLGMLSAAGACATKPATRTAPPAPLSEAEEIDLGRDADEYLANLHRFYDDSAWGLYVQQVGMRLAAKCERPGLPWTFRVMDDPTVNAFALPGGFVYVTRGMLAYLNSEAQLAAVIGHEIGHVAARHVVSRNTRVEMTSMGLVVASAAGAVTPVQGSVERLQAVLLAHSREAEQRADSLGLHYMSDAGYDPAEMPGVLHAIERAVGRGVSPAWLATHPSWERRFENLAVAQSNLTNPGGLVEHDRYLAHLDGLTFGPDRRGGYIKGSRFVRPSRGYQITFPSGWTVSSDGSAVRGRSPGQDAVIEVMEADQPTADSAANVFFAKLARLRDARTRSQVNGLTVVSGGFSWLPQERLRGSASFIEHGGRVYRVMGYTGNREWAANQAWVEATLRTFEPVPDSVIRQAQPLRVATFSLARPASISALVTARPTSVQPADLALMNQVPSDSLLPAGRRVKWVVGAGGI